MHKGCAQIVIAPVGRVPVVTVVVMMVVIVVMVMMALMIVVVLMIVTMSMSMVMVVIITQQKGAHQVDDKTQECNRNGLGEGNLDRVDKPLDRLIGNEERHHGKHDGARKGREVAELAGAEGEPMVVRIAAGIGIGERRDQQRAGVGGHVQAVGDQSDRAEPDAADDLSDHHGGGDADDDPGLALVVLMSIAEEVVLVSQIVDRAHGSLPLPGVLSGVLWARPLCWGDSGVRQRSSIGQFGCPSRVTR